METIKSIIKSFLSLLFTSFLIGYVVGNYYGVKSVVNEPGVFTFSIIPAYIILRFNDNPEIMKFNGKDADGNIVYDNSPKE